jgi:hypothetical protein
MNKYIRFGVGLAGALLLMSPLAYGDDKDSNVTLLFINQSSASLTVYFDGAMVCNLAPRASCSTAISEIADHEVSATGGGSYHIKVDGSECWLDTVVLTFTDQDVSQSCKGDKDG